MIGWAHEIKTLTRENALAFYQKWYAPNNAVLVVAGDITMDELKPLAEKYYGGIPARVVLERTRPLEPEQISARRIEFSHPQVGQVKLEPPLSGAELVLRQKWRGHAACRAGGRDWRWGDQSAAQSSGD